MGRYESQLPERECLGSGQTEHTQTHKSPPHGKPFPKGFGADIRGACRLQPLQHLLIIRKLDSLSPRSLSAIWFALSQNLT
jgi:hypothetical protein